MNTLAFLKNYTTPSRFIHQKLEKKRPEGLVFILVINALIGAFLMPLYLGYLFNFSLETNFSIFLMFAVYLLGGIIYSLLRYFVFGWIFHLFVLLAGGKGNYLTSRNIFLFARVPVNIFVLIYFLYGGIQPFLSFYFHFYLPSFPLWPLYLVTTSFNLYSFVLIYKAAKEKQKTMPIRSLIFFIILPILYILLAVLPVPSFLL